MSPTNDERRSLNEAIRPQLKLQDRLGKDDWAASVLVSLDLIATQGRRAASISRGALSAAVGEAGPMASSLAIIARFRRPLITCSSQIAEAAPK